MGIGGENGVFGWITLLIAHITFNVPYVILMSAPSCASWTAACTTAALDLGCTPRQAFFKVIPAAAQPGHHVAF